MMKASSKKSERKAYERSSQIGILVLVAINLLIELVQLFRVNHKFWSILKHKGVILDS